MNLRRIWRNNFVGSIVAVVLIKVKGYKDTRNNNQKRYNNQ